MSNPYYSRIEFDRESSDSGMLPFEIASTNIASTNIASTEINSAETAETAPDNPSFLPTTMAFNQTLPLAGFAFPGSSSSGSLDGPELVDFNTVQRSRKRRRHIWTVGEKKRKKEGPFLFIFKGGETGVGWG